MLTWTTTTRGSLFTAARTADGRSRPAASTSRLGRLQSPDATTERLVACSSFRTRRTASHAAGSPQRRDGRASARDARSSSASSAAGSWRVSTPYSATGAGGLRSAGLIALAFDDAEPVADAAGAAGGASTAGASLDRVERSLPATSTTRASPT